VLAFLAGCGDRPATGPPESFVWLAFRERGERRGGDLVVFRPSVAGWEEAVLETFDEGGATSFGVGMRAFPDGSTRAWHGRRLWRSRDGGRSWEEIASPVQPIDPSLGRDSSIVEVVPGPNGEAWLAYAVQLEILPSLVVGVSREIDPGGFRVVPLADPPYASWDPTRRFAMGSRDGRLEIVRQPVEDGFLRSPYEGPVIEVPGEDRCARCPPAAATSATRPRRIGAGCSLAMSCSGWRPTPSFSSATRRRRAYAASTSSIGAAVSRVDPTNASRPRRAATIGA
jgi:hypothetical protein